MTDLQRQYELWQFYKRLAREPGGAVTIDEMMDLISIFIDTETEPDWPDSLFEDT